jgi:hypothetical protein
MTFTNLTRLPIILFLIPMLYCSSNLKTTKRENPGQLSDWTLNHPVSSTHFIGIGSAKISNDKGDVQKAAKNSALQDIASQIKIKVIAHVGLSEIKGSNGNQSFDSTLYREKINSYTDAILEGVEIAETKNTPDGYYWVKIALNKEAYYTKINEKIENAKKLALDGLISAEDEDVLHRIHELLASLQAIDGFTANLLTCRIEEREIILNTEILRRLRQTMEDLRFEPVFDYLEINALDTVPDTIGFYLTYKKNPVENCPLIWSVSNNDVKLQVLPAKTSGLYPVYISSLSSSTGRTTVSATIDLGSIHDNLEKYGIRLPEGQFILARKKPALYLLGKGEFLESLAQETAGCNMFTVVSLEQEADYTMKCSFVIDSNIVIQKSIYKANGILDGALSKRGQPPSVQFRKTLNVGSAQSAQAAVESLKKEALHAAAKELLRAF